MAILPAMRYGGDDQMLFQGGNGIVVYNYKKKQSATAGQKNGLSSPGDTDVHGLLQ